MNKVLLIDPWGIANTSEYLNGLIYGLNGKVSLIVFTNKYFILKVPSDAEIHKIFFGKSEKMKHGMARTIIRGIEYYISYRHIFRYLRKNGKMDVIHINWLLKYKMDNLFIKKMRNYTKKIVYTAHNVIPHINGEDSINILNEIYNQMDTIILHGNAIKKEFETYFPQYVRKIYIQKHGCNINPNITYEEKKISTDIVNKVNEFERVYIFFGNIFFNKGIDRIVKIWKTDWNDTLLIIAGRRSGKYKELEELNEKINESNNILFLDKFVDNNTLNYLITKSCVILLPYRHASMSGVVFTAADFSKTIMSTDVGAISEYLNNGVDSFVVENDDLSIGRALEKIRNTDLNTLRDMGENLKKDISQICSWRTIGDKIIREVYLN